VPATRSVAALVSRATGAELARRSTLREAGIVEVRGDAQRRLYRVRAEPLRDLDEWLRPYRRLWAASLDALEGHLATIDHDRADGGGMIRHDRAEGDAMIGYDRAEGDAMIGHDRAEGDAMIARAERRVTR
jgi:hypothetical protein